MADVQKEKVQAALSRMDDNYWDAVVKRTTVLEIEAQRLTGVFMDEYIKLLVAQVDVMAAKYNGYKLLAANEDENAVAGIVAENRERIGELAQEKQRALAALTKTLADLQTAALDGGTLGEGKR